MSYEAGLEMRGDVEAHIGGFGGRGQPRPH